MLFYVHDETTGGVIPGPHVANKLFNNLAVASDSYEISIQGIQTYGDTSDCAYMMWST